jgi:hypothetical protein
VSEPPVVYRLRAKIDELRDRIEELERELSRRRHADRSRATRRCVYCGLPLRQPGIACQGHADLPALESGLGL